MIETQAIQRWHEDANKLKAPKDLNVPLNVLIGESVETSKFTTKYWEPTDKRPGLSSAGSKLPKTTAEDILSLREATQDCQTAYRLVVDPKVNTAELMERGDFVLNEMTSALEWYLDDGVEDRADLQFKSLKDAHEDDTDAADPKAQALHDYATLAKEHQDDLAGLGGFDVKIIQEAFTLAEKLGEVTHGGRIKSEQAKEAIDLRNRMATLLMQRVRLVRSAARFVFRGHKDIIREVTSSYERRRRAENRRAKQTAVTL